MCASLESLLMSSCRTKQRPTPIFIVAAPRTGSTFFYQALCLSCRLPYFSNLANDMFPDAPLVGLALQHGIPQPRSFRSRYGKTRDLFEPSEASSIMRNWFGGEHPSQTRSAKVLRGKKSHLVKTLACAQNLYTGLPVVIKNAWNCFRIKSLAQVLPGARFIWLTRDMARAALSDLEARYQTRGDPCAWNSATPANVTELQVLPPEYQVVENQFQFNLAIRQSLSALPKKRWRHISYERFLAKPNEVIVSLSKWLSLSARDGGRIITRKSHAYKYVSRDQVKAVETYILVHKSRLAL
jgi:hypothetical protein